ncbi:tetratricopeptide repeat protein [Amphritea atlantica]|uniref:Tetratricopeptide repeat protein n=1 Tax=Amphritea atlantica TaxID=355243 RepID=A0ABY5GRL2_9GAMM|nr:tetratricopeptide repeat protein [Amphritea atlantica]
MSNRAADRVITLMMVVGLLITAIPVSAETQKDNYCQSAGADNDYDCSKNLSFPDDQTDLDAKLKALNSWLEDEQQTQSDNLLSVEKPSSDNLRERIQFNSTLLAAELQRVKQLQNNGNDAAAFNQVNNYLVNHPRDPNGWLLYGISLINKNKPDDAAKIFRSLIKLYPQAPEPYNNLAAIYARQGDNEKAIELLQQAFETHPSYAQVQRNLKAIYAGLAKKAYNKALDLDNGQSAARINLGVLDQVYHPPYTLPDPIADAASAGQSVSNPVIEERLPSEGLVPDTKDDAP